MLFAVASVWWAKCPLMTRAWESELGAADQVAYEARAAMGELQASIIA